MTTAPRAIPCRDCAALVTDTDAAIAQHRGDHKNTTARLDGMTRALRAATSEISSLQARIADLGRQIDNIEIPEQIEPLHIADASEWPDDDDSDDGADASQYADEDVTFPEPDDDPPAATNPDNYFDDDPAPAVVTDHPAVANIRSFNP